MKKGILIITLLLNTWYVFSQNMIKEKIYSNELKDTVSYRVWLPEDWDKEKKHCVIYTVEDGEDEMLASVVGYYSRLIPGTVVVGIVNGRGLINYDFSTGLLNKGGAEFINCLSKEIMPLVDQKYNTPLFKAFMGHSYSATYANYLFLYHPGMFNAFMLFAPEKWWTDESKPPFELTAEIKQYYNTHKTFYFLSSGGKDISRRRDYAKEIAKKLSQSDTNKFIFQYKHIEDANHLSIVPDAMAAGLEHIFKPYYLYKNTDSVADPLTFFSKTKTQLKDLYGIELEKNNNNIAIFSDLAAASKDKKAMSAFADYFLDDSIKGLDLRNFAYSCAEMNYKEKAKEIYERCITKSKKDELKTQQGPLNLVMAYRELAYKVYKDDTPQAWNTLQKAIDDKDMTDITIMHYYIGKLAADKSYKPKEGLEHLLLYSKSNLKDGIRWGVTPDAVYCKIGKCYFSLNDKTNAKIYLQKSLIENPNNKEAKEAMEKL